jgi:N-acetylated-alpha-linked acidic dipeptidase
MNRKRQVAGLFSAAALLGAAPASTPDPVLFGFSQKTSAEEVRREDAFRATPDPAAIRENMRHLSARPHHVGSPYDRENAEWILSRFKAWGFEAEIERFDVLYPTPSDRLVEMTSPRKFRAALEEPALAVDPTSGQKSEQLPTFNVYSIDGDVTAPLVYVNYGVPADYEELSRLNVSVKGAIVIARYGGSWRGIKPKVAAEHGAVGCLIYSDPKDDGFSGGEPFPKGPMRPPDGAQRGSVADMPLYPGDPQTPGYGSTPGAVRLPLDKVATLTKIPVLPISYADAEPLLENLSGPLAPEKWRGALPITYRVGPGAATVHLRVKFHWDVKPIYDVVAKIPGAEFPDQWVIRGNHHDAWVNGAEDPISGQSAMLEEARAISELRRTGWRPKRTIVYCAWDGEEPGLLGSTEWVETHAEELSRKGVAYINTDSTGRGFLDVGASHSLDRLIAESARDVTDPEAKISVGERLQRKQIFDAATPAEAAKLRSRKRFAIDSLGSGSDYTAFLDRLGIPSMNLAFGGEDDGGIYHSIYDDFYWYTHFSDTEFVYGRALAQTAGTAVLRLADADILPFDYPGLADAVVTMVDEVTALARTEREEAEARNRDLDEGVYEGANDPKHPRVAPAREVLPPFLNFSPLENAREELKGAARRYETALAAIRSDGVSAAAAADLNSQLIQLERKLTSPAGLPNRAWFRHQLYAPGFYTGYGVKTLPAIREAIEQKDWKLADAQIGVVSQIVAAEARAILDAAALLEKGPATAAK